MIASATTREPSGRPGGSRRRCRRRRRGRTASPVERPRRSARRRWTRRRAAGPTPAASEVAAAAPGSGMPGQRPRAGRARSPPGRRSGARGEARAPPRPVRRGTAVATRIRMAGVAASADGQDVRFVELEATSRPVTRPGRCRARRWRSLRLTSCAAWRRTAGRRRRCPGWCGTSCCWRSAERLAVHQDRPALVRDLRVDAEAHGVVRVDLDRVGLLRRVALRAGLELRLAGIPLPSS